MPWSETACASHPHHERSSTSPRSSKAARCAKPSSAPKTCARFDPEDIQATLARVPRRPGTRRLQDLITLLAPDKDNARSHLERLFLRLIRKARLPKPACNHEIAERSRDFVRPEQRLVVEADGYRFHSSRQAKRRDNRRDRQLTALGWRPVRFTYEEIVFEPAEVAAELAALLRLP
jgi:very-short-patch-repair endonuclease